MLLMMLEKGIPVHKVLFADVGMPAEFPIMYDYLERVAAYILMPSTTVRSENHPVVNMFYVYPTRGRYTHDIRGVPPTVGYGCRHGSCLTVALVD